MKISIVSFTSAVALLLLIGFSSGSILSAGNAYAHTFSASESAQFLSLTEQIKAETDLVVMNLANNNVTLAQEHAEKALHLLDNHTLDEIREENTRIANSLAIGLEQLEANVTSLAAASQVAPQKVQSVNQTVVPLKNTLAEAVSVRVEVEQQNNATMWATVVANLTNVVLSNYGNAIGAPFDLTNTSNLGTDQNMTTMDNNNQTMQGNGSSIVDISAYQSAQYLTNNTVLQVFNDTLKPLTNTNDSEAPAIGNNTTSNLDRLETNLLKLRDDINNKASANEVMTTVHVRIHPLLIQLYELEVQQEHQEHTNGH